MKESVIWHLLRMLADDSDPCCCNIAPAKWKQVFSEAALKYIWMHCMIPCLTVCRPHSSTTSISKKVIPCFLPLCPPPPPYHVHYIHVIHLISSLQLKESNYAQHWDTLHLFLGFLKTCSRSEKCDLTPAAGGKANRNQKKAVTLTGSHISWSRAGVGLILRPGVSCFRPAHFTSRLTILKCN